MFQPVSLKIAVLEVDKTVDVARKLTFPPPSVNNHPVFPRSLAAIIGVPMKNLIIPCVPGVDLE